MFWLNVALIITLFLRFISSLPIDKPVPIVREITSTQSSDGSNIAVFDLLDDSTIDFHFDSPCADCKCFVDPPVLKLQDLKTVSLSPKSIRSYVDFDKIITIQQTDLNDISFSMYRATSDQIQEIKGNTILKSYKEARHVIYSPHEQAFVGFTDDTVFINKVDGYGNLKETAYKHSQIGEYFDMVYAGGLLFIAKGELGIEVLDFYEDLSGPHIESYVLTIQDLELQSGYKVTKLAVDYKRRALYAFELNSENDFLLALDLTNKEEISISNNYKLNFTNIIDFIPANNDLHVLYSHRNNYYYTQLSTLEDIKYAQFFASKLWKMPVKVKRLARNDNKLIIQAEKYIYSFRTAESYGENTHIFVDIISTETGGDFFSYSNKDSINILAISENQIALSSIIRGQNPSLKCGVFRKDYEEGKEEFNILIIKDTCEEKEPQQLPLCVYLYRYEIEFNIETYSPATVSRLVPQAFYHSPGEENQIVDSQPTTNPNEGEEEEEPFPNNPKPNEPTPGVEEPGQNTEEPFSEEEEEEEPTNQHPHTGSDGGEPTIEPEPEPEPGSDSSDETDSDSPIQPDENIDIKKPDLIDPDAPYYDKVQNMYALVLVGIIVVTCFGCLIKCLCDFTRNQAKIDAQFKHKQLKEEEDSENPGENSEDEQNSEIKI